MDITQQHNRFKGFISKIFRLPLWVKQVIYIELKDQIESRLTQISPIFIRKEDCFQLYLPKITFLGKRELDTKAKDLPPNVYKFLEGHKAVYDIIVADPPYNFTQEQFEEIVSLVFENELLNEDGMMIIEHSKYTRMQHLMNFSFEKKYGGSIFSFFEFDKDESEEPLGYDIDSEDDEI